MPSEKTAGDVICAREGSSETVIEYLNSVCVCQCGGVVAVHLTESKGRVLVARRAFKQGDVILKEAPLHRIAEAPGVNSFEAVRAVCAQNLDFFPLDPFWYFAAVSSLTDEQLSDANGSSRLPPAVSVDTQHRMLLLHGTEDVKLPGPAAFILVNELRLHKVDPLVLEHLLRVWTLNCFDCSDQPMTCALYFIPSFMSHSCSPSAIWNLEGESFVLRARCEIKELDEVTISYLSEEQLLETAPWRIERLYESKHFWCSCARCAVGSQDLSRGFFCPSCRAGVVFCRVIPRSLYASSRKRKRKHRQLGCHIVEAEALLANVACPLCGYSLTSADAENLVDEEHRLRDKLDDLLRQSISSSCSMTDELLKRIETHFAQHVNADKAYSLLVGCYSTNQQWETTFRIMQRRGIFHRDAYPGLHIGEARVLEMYADLLLARQDINLKDLQCSIDKGHALDFQNLSNNGGVLREALTKSCETLASSLEILSIAFGEEHVDCREVGVKLGLVRKALEALADET